MGFIRGLSCASGREGDDDGREVECVVDGRSQADMAVPLRSECGSEAYNLSPRTMIEGLIKIGVYAFVPRAWRKKRHISNAWVIM